MMVIVLVSGSGTEIARWTDLPNDAPVPLLDDYVRVGDKAYRVLQRNWDCEPAKHLTGNVNIPSFIGWTLFTGRK